jgi:transcription elongation factor Elf1
MLRAAADYIEAKLDDLQPDLPKHVFCEPKQLTETYDKEVRVWDYRTSQYKKEIRTVAERKLEYEFNCPLCNEEGKTKRKGQYICKNCRCRFEVMSVSFIGKYQQAVAYKSYMIQKFCDILKFNLDMRKEYIPIMLKQIEDMLYGWTRKEDK